MPYGPTIQQQKWKMLDDLIDEIMAHSDTERERNSYKIFQARARQMAVVLALSMQPFFHTADEIAEEAMRRYEARKRGDTEYETPGIGTQRYQPPPGSKRYGDTTRTERKSPKSKIPSDAVEGIKKALESGSFSVKQVADLYKVPEAEVQALKP